MKTARPADNTPMMRRVVSMLVAGFALAAAAALYAAAQPPTYRGQIELVAARGNAPLSPSSKADRSLAATLAELVRSNVLATNVRDALGLDETPQSLLERISVQNAQPAVLRISVTDRNRVRATRTAVEVGLIFGRLVQARFGARGSHQPVHADVWDAGHAVPSSKVGGVLESGLIGALIGALAGLLLSNLRWRTRETPVVRAAAARAEVEPAPAQLEPIRAVPAPVPAPAPMPEPDPQPESEPPPAAVVPIGIKPDQNVLALDRLVEARASDFPARADEWRYYVTYLRDFAEADGGLPPELSTLVADVFAELLPRAA
jgi:capsular polysaccharide biosynthesis protein